MLHHFDPVRRKFDQVRRQEARAHKVERALALFGGQRWPLPHFVAVIEGNGDGDIEFLAIQLRVLARRGVDARGFPALLPTPSRLPACARSSSATTSKAALARSGRHKT